MLRRKFNIQKLEKALPSWCKSFADSVSKGGAFPDFIFLHTSNIIPYPKRFLRTGGEISYGME
ncbi:hypothetical protein C4588_05760 [Candidatus Parcubacteria bacterium]|nr:MAG: hypothetical protein C4588_05760 [Candidatus Parcubacteria bacterium]